MTESTGTAGASDRHAVVIVASTRAAAGAAEDRTGPLIAAWLAGNGWSVDAPRVVADGQPVADALADAIVGRAGLVITTGGTGLSPDDRTPDVTKPLLEREIPGFMEELRRRGAEHTPTALLSRGHAGVTGTTVIVNLPGSPGGVRDGLDILGGMLDHLLDQLSGGKSGH